jgi:hypothetical protein
LVMLKYSECPVNAGFLIGEITTGCKCRRNAAIIPAPERLNLGKTTSI